MKYICLCLFAAFVFVPGTAYSELNEEDAQKRAESCLAQGCARSSTLRFKKGKIVAKTSVLKLDRSKVKLNDSRLQSELDALNAKISETEIRITLKNGVLFAFDEFSLRPEAIIVLNKVLRIIQFEKFRKSPLRIEGHTDWIGSDDYNNKLSVQRAKSVAGWLKKNGVRGRRLQTSGYGESSPVDTNETDEGRQNNRRVEIVLEHKSKL